MSLRILALLSLAVGCGRSTEDGAELCIVPNEDSETWGDEPVEVAAAAGDTLLLRAVATFGCHSTDHAVDCVVTEESPGVFVVTTETTWTRTEPLAMSCESILFAVAGFCETPPLPDGPVVLKYAGNELPLDVPGVATGCLAGNRPGE